MVRRCATASRRPDVRTLSAAVLCLCTGAASANLIETRGDARDIESGVLLYTEQHLLRLENDAPRERLVVYRCPDGRAFGRKTVAYDDATPAAPAFELQDARLDYREGARRNGDGFTTYSDIGAQGEPDGATVEETPDLVVDAGFDTYVRKHWTALQAGEKRSVDFLVPSRGRAYAFNVVKLRDESIGGAPASVFRLRLGGLLGWLVSDIDVSYRNSDQRLMRFEGLTNIRVNAEDLVAARIDFPVAAERNAPDPALWQTLRSEPLTDCPLGTS